MEDYVSTNKNRVMARNPCYVHTLHTKHFKKYSCLYSFNYTCYNTPSDKNGIWKNIAHISACTLLVKTRIYYVGTVSVHEDKKDD